MARGFESKSVQSQWQDAEADADARKRGREDREVIERRKRRESLELSRRRVERELAETQSDRRREQLRAALAPLGGELQEAECGRPCASLPGPQGRVERLQETAKPPRNGLPDEGQPAAERAEAA